MPKAKAPTKVWSPDFSLAPSGTIGACFNADGTAWWWSVKPEIEGSEKRPWDLKWRGPEYGIGYSIMGPVPSGTSVARWKESWIAKS
jgi:hypothetical protein